MSTFIGSLTLKADRIVGSKADEHVEVPSSNANLSAQDVIRAGAGVDTLVFQREADLSVSADRMRGVSGIDVLDVRAANSALLSISDALLDSTDADRTTILHGDTPLQLDLRDVSAGEGRVMLAGTGQVNLYDAPQQSVTLVGGNNGRISGGSGQDTIIGASGNDTLNGGAGDDRLVAANGSDRLTGGGGNDVFAIGTAAGATVITDMDADNLLEVIDLTAFSGLRGMQDLAITTAGNNTQVSGAGLNVTVQGVQAEELDAGNFVFAGQSGAVFNINPSTSLARIQQLLDEAPAGAVIRMAAGVYDITEGLLISRSDITLEGAGEGKTILRTEIATDEAAPTLTVRPDRIARQVGTIAEDAEAGSSTVTLQAGHGLRAGDILYVSQANDAQWLAETGNTGWREPEATPATENRFYLREQHSRIVSIDGNTVTLAEPLAYTFAADKAQAAQSTFLSGVHLSGFTIQGTFGKPDPYFFDNALKGWTSIPALEVDGVTQSTLSDITILNPASHAFSFQRNYEVTGNGLTAIGAMNKDGSNGYHFYLQESFANTFTDLYSEGARHAILTSSYSAEHYNTLVARFLDRDINFHGSPDADNTIVVDRQVQNYPDGSNPQWSAVHPGVFPLHPYSTIEDNDVTFKFARSGDRADRVVAHSSGGDIATGFGGDTIIGGAGRDTIDGGQGDDVLQGGRGQDLFIRRLTDGDDLIIDFATGSGGDVVVIRNTAYASFDQLRLLSSGNDTILDFGPGGRIVLRDTRPADFRAENFQLLPDGGSGQLVEPKSGDRFALGTGQSDVFVLSRYHMDVGFDMLAGEGQDRVIFNLNFLSGDLADLVDFSGADVFDFSRVGKVDIEMSNALAGQSDTGRITLAAGDKGSVLLLDADQMGRGHSLWIDGARDVQLTGNSDHVLHVTDRIGAHITGASGSDVIHGGRSSDWLNGAAGKDTLMGAGGNDTLHGGAGADLLNGGPGSDTIIVDNIGDRVAESRKWAGEDHVMSSVDFRLGTAHVENLTLTGVGDIRGVGNGLQNRITGNSGDNILDGGKNNDTLIGGQGNDTYYIRAPGDRAIEKAGEGVDTVFAFRSTTLTENVENLTLQTSVALTGRGNGLDNTITGNNASNVLAGGLGNDILRGQGGNDVFVFDTAPSARNVDTIVDFNGDQDLLRLSTNVFKGVPRGDLANDAFREGVVARDANDRVIYDQTTGRLWFDADGDGESEKRLFAILTNKADLGADDLLFG